MIDENGSTIETLHPPVVVDAILAKKNLGTKITDAPVVIGVGPGFCAGKDVDAVIETQRGHNLGRVIYEGEAAPNTGIPGRIAGYAKERVIHAPAAGNLHILKQIGEIVQAGDTIADIEGTPVKTVIGGVLRGMIREGYPVKKGLKIADVDPRVKEQENCYHISDKARCVAGGVLEAILHLSKQVDGPQNTNLHFVPKTENQDLVFYFHFTGLLSQILLSCVIIAQLSDIRDKYIRYEEILRENMILWRKLINESAGIYEQGIILVKV